MNKKLVKFDDSNNANQNAARNKIRKRKSTPYVSKNIKSVAHGLKPKVCFDIDGSDVEQNIQKKNSKRQATPYRVNKKLGAISDDLRKDLFSVNINDSNIEINSSFENSSPLSTIKSTPKSSKTVASFKTGMEVQEMNLDSKNNLITIEFQDNSSDDSDLFNPTFDNSTFNGSCEKIGTRKKKRKISRSKADKHLLPASPLPTNFNDLDTTVDPNSPAEDESATEELNNEQFYDETEENIEVSSEGENIEVPSEGENIEVSSEGENIEVSSEGENIEISSEGKNIEVDDFQEAHKNITKNYILFTYNDINLLVLNPNSKLYFNGLIFVTVLHGEVEILGYTLTSSSASQNVYSSRGTSHLYFEAKSCIKNQYDDDFMNKIRKLIPKAELPAFKKVLKIDSCILMYKNIKQQNITFLEKHISQTLFPEEGCIFREIKKDWNILKVDPKWDEIADSMIFNSKLLLAGGKGVGKSTMLRYILNKLLLKNKHVMVIDLDPGQPEFTLPGCISTHIINEPVFGSNYTHLRTPHRCVFVSDLNLSTMPINYLKKVKELYDAGYTELGLPTIINYVGLTRENGLDLLSTVILCAKPTTIVDIRSENESRNFVEPLSRDLLEDSKLYSPSMYFSIEEFPKFKIEVVSSLCDSSRGWLLSSRNIREMIILSYFGNIFPEDDLNLESTPDFVYKISISHIKLKAHGKECKINLIDQGLGAMCSDDGICYGWGIVCTVDLDKNELYIQTPMPSDMFSLVSTLNLGSVHLPSCFYMAYNYSDIPNKYVCSGKIEDTGRLPMRSFLPVTQYQN